MVASSSAGSWQHRARAPMPLATAWAEKQATGGGNKNHKGDDGRWKRNPRNDNNKNSSSKLPSVGPSNGERTPLPVCSAFVHMFHLCSFAQPRRQSPAQGEHPVIWTGLGKASPARPRHDRATCRATHNYETFLQEYSTVCTSLFGGWLSSLGDKGRF